MFTHIYVEKRAAEHPLTQRIIRSSGISDVISIDHYKDVFNRPRQDYRHQMNEGRSLILAVNKGNLIYEGAPLCQDFGYENVCYCTNIMGCVFDCEYCFLKGMYRTAACVIFVNIEDYERAVDEHLKEGPLYLSLSYESDLASFEHMTGLCSCWEDIALKRKDLTIELRTKAAPSSFVPADNIIYAFTLSPRPVIERFEKKTASLDMRIRSVNKALEEGASVRLCFDPLIYVKDAYGCYNEFMDEILSKIDISKVKDIGIGAFRIPAEYIKPLRRISPSGAAVNFPFENREGVMRYPESLERELTGIIRGKLKGNIDAKRIFEI